MSKSIFFTILFMLGCDNSIPTNPDKPGGDDDNPDATQVDDDGDGFNTDVDCDDTDPTVHPEADEICDLQDNDCDNLVDAADDSLVDPIMAYEDTDNDGFGDPDSSVIVCSISSICDGFNCPSTLKTTFPSRSKISTSLLSSARPHCSTRIFSISLT